MCVCVCSQIDTFVYLSECIYIYIYICIYIYIYMFSNRYVCVSK